MQELLSIIGIVISFILMIAFFSKNTYKYLGIVFLICALILFEDYLWHSKLITKLSFLTELFSPLSFFIPAFLLLHFNFDSLTKPIKYIFLSLPIIAFINFSPLYLNTKEYKSCYIFHEINNCFSHDCDIFSAFSPVIINDDYLDYLLLVLFVIAFFIIIMKNKQLLFNIDNKRKSLKKKNWEKLSLFLILFTILSTFMGIFFIPESYSVKSIFIPIISIVVCIHFLLNSEVLKYKNQSNNYSATPTLEIELIYNQLEEFLNRKEVYSNPNLTLNFVSKELDISSNKLSYIINESNQTFRNLLNKIRIRNAIKLMNSSKGAIYSIEGISKTIGYKSKSTFYQNFKKEMSVTPKEYVKNKV